MEAFRKIAGAISTCNSRSHCEQLIDFVWFLHASKLTKKQYIDISLAFRDENVNVLFLHASKLTKKQYNDILIAKR